MKRGLREGDEATEARVDELSAIRSRQFLQNPRFIRVNPRLKKMQISIGIITVSDRAAAGKYDDLGGPALRDFAEKNGWQVLGEVLVPDEIARISDAIESLSKQGCDLILTTGGTGMAAVVEGALVIALPGKPSGAVECLTFVIDAIPHAVKLARGEPTSC